MAVEPTWSFCVLRDAGQHWRRKSGPKGFYLSWVGCPLIEQEQQYPGGQAMSPEPRAKHRLGAQCVTAQLWGSRCRPQARPLPAAGMTLAAVSCARYLVQQEGALAGQAPGVIHDGRDVPVRGVGDRRVRQALSRHQGYSSFCCQQFPLLAEVCLSSYTSSRLFWHDRSVKCGSITHCTPRTNGELWNSLLSVTPKILSGENLLCSRDEHWAESAMDWSIKSPVSQRIQTHVLHKGSLPSTCAWNFTMERSPKCERKSLNHFGPFQWGKLLPADWTPHHYKPARPHHGDC